MTGARLNSFRRCRILQNRNPFVTVFTICRDCHESSKPMKQGQNPRRPRGRGRKPQNPLGRSMDSNGPDVKVRGTAQHICDKYQNLARDAHSAGDRIAAENYYQHAEHYLRLILQHQSTNEQQNARHQNNNNDDGRNNGEEASGSSDDNPQEAAQGTNAEPGREGSEAAQPSQSNRSEAGQSPRRRQPRRRRPPKTEASASDEGSAKSGESEAGDTPAPTPTPDTASA